MSFDWLLLSDSVRGPSHWADCFRSTFQPCIHKTSPDFRGFPRVSPFTCWRCYPLCRADPLLGLSAPRNCNQYDDCCLCAHSVCRLQQAEADAPKSHAGCATVPPPNSPEGELFGLAATASNQILCAHSVCRLQQAEADAPKSHAGCAAMSPPNSPEGELFDFTATNDWPSLLHSFGLVTSASQGHRPKIALWRRMQPGKIPNRIRPRPYRTSFP